METFFQFILFLLSSFGMSFIVTQSKLFIPLRTYLSKKNSFLHSLFTCIFCFGTWTAFFIRFLMMLWLRDPFTMIWRDGIDIFLHGMAGGIVCYFGYLFYLKLDENKT